MSPKQINIIPVNNEFQLEYANEVLKELSDFRASVDDRDEKLSYKMRESVIKKIPYTLILGDKEKDTKTISYRKRGSNDTINLSIEDFKKLLYNEIESKGR